MSASFASGPHCARCSHPLEEKGGILIHDGRPPTAVCFDCVDDMKVIADHSRAPGQHALARPEDPKEVADGWYDKRRAP